MNQDLDIFFLNAVFSKCSVCGNTSETCVCLVCCATIIQKLGVDFEWFDGAPDINIWSASNNYYRQLIDHIQSPHLEHKFGNLAQFKDTASPAAIVFQQAAQECRLLWCYDDLGCLGVESFDEEGEDSVKEVDWENIAIRPDEMESMKVVG